MVNIVRSGRGCTNCGSKRVFTKDRFLAYFPKPLRRTLIGALAKYPTSKHITLQYIITVYEQGQNLLKNRDKSINRWGKYLVDFAVEYGRISGGLQGNRPVSEVTVRRAITIAGMVKQ